MAEMNYWSAPGNILIAGEYLITEDGGLGLALSGGARGSLTTRKSEAMSVHGKWPGGSIDWCQPTVESRESGKVIDSQDSAGQASTHAKCGNIDETSLPGCVHNAILKRRPHHVFPSIELFLDTSDFYRSDGAKRGYGSSALSALLLTRAMLDADDPEIPAIAVEAHRAFQGGHGSGYDVLCSYYGGCGLFTGGTSPTWQSLNWPNHIRTWLIRGLHPISSADAVGHFHRWKETNMTTFGEITADTISAIKRMRQSLPGSSSRRPPNPGVSADGDDADFIEALRQLSQLGARLGASIGVPATPKLSDYFPPDLASGRRDGIAVKCLGAGDELMLLAGLPEAFSHADLRLIEKLVRNGIAERLQKDDSGLTREGGE